MADSIGIKSIVIDISTGWACLSHYMREIKAFQPGLPRWRDIVVEMPLLEQFFSSQLHEDPNETETQSLVDSGMSKYCYSLFSASDMACTVARRLASQVSGALQNTSCLIYFSSTLHETPAWSTVCRLHHELGLKSADAFSVGQSSFNSSFVALRCAAERMLTEPDTSSVLLVGSDRVVPPMRRCTRDLYLESDSACTLLVGKEDLEYRLLGMSFDDCDSVDLSSASGEQHRHRYWPERLLASFNSVLCRLNIDAAQLRSVLLPNWNKQLLSSFLTLSGLRAQQLLERSADDVYYFGSSDLAIQLDRRLRVGDLKPGDLVVVLGVTPTGYSAAALFEHRGRAILS